ATATQLALPPSPQPSSRVASRPVAAVAVQPTKPAPVPAVAPKTRRRPVPAAPARAAAGHHARFEIDSKSMPILAALGRNLTLAAAEGLLDPVFGREAEIDRTLDV